MAIRLWSPVKSQLFNPYSRSGSGVLAGWPGFARALDDRGTHVGLRSSPGALTNELTGEGLHRLICRLCTAGRRVLHVIAASPPTGAEPWVGCRRSHPSATLAMVDGKPIQDPQQLSIVLFSKRVGDVLHFTLRSPDGTPASVDVTVARRPSDPESILDPTNLSEDLVERLGSSQFRFRQTLPS